MVNVDVVAAKLKTLSQELASAMSQAVGLRNIVAHAYGRLDIAVLHPVRP